MATIELRLNSKKPGNYAFFCPVTKIHLTIANPVGFTNRVSNYILRGLKSKTLIDVNNVVDLETGNVVGVKKEEQVKVPESEKPAQDQVIQEPEGLSQAPEAGVNLTESKQEETNPDTAEGSTEENKEVNNNESASETQNEENQSEDEEENETVEETTTEAKETKKRGRRAQN